jgi:glycosyltransferase involved in cell wall biosynthesis
MGLERLTKALRRVRPATAAPGFGHIEHGSNPTHPETLPEFQMFAVVKTWMDEDVIEATVRNALVQGAETVYIVDNGSTDETVPRAVDAGAIVAEVYRTEVFDGRLVQPLMNAVVARESLRCEAEHVWWLFLDSDEFPEGPDGTLVRDYLATLDRRFRIVGAKYVNHVPSAKPEYLSGFHPIDFQPLCYEFVPARWPPCQLGHWKHPLQRFDRHGHFLLSNDGAHSGFCSETLVEPNGGIVTHHFQYRDENLTRAKLEMTCGPGSTRTSLHESTGFDGFVRRRRSLDAVYNQRWRDVDTIPNKNVPSSYEPTPWAHVGRVRRWYEVAEVEAARSKWISETERANRSESEAPKLPLGRG